MSDQQPFHRPAQMPVPPNVYAPPQARPVSAAYRRWASVLVGLAIVIAVFLVVAFVTSIVFLVLADADTNNAALGYLAIVLWVGIVAAIPLLLAVAIPAAAMKRRVRQQRRAGITPS
ncbi:hypothetical protein [Spirillospora sp. NPDC047279]|uniref:hypothetical protein n=1 Tax=Spirillospora sp. NPDC047279 TaxID=3155478 RepID=UPI0033EC709A